MMRPRLLSLAALAALLAGLPAAAQEALRLRASEFSSFSRVAIDLPADARWEVQRDGRALTLRLPGTAGEVNVAAIFPERRISRVLRATAERRGEGAEITFSLACACEADVYKLGARTLVLDFRDGADEEPPRAEPPAARATAAAERPAERAAPAAVPRAAAPAPTADDAPARQDPAHQDPGHADPADHAAPAHDAPAETAHAAPAAQGEEAHAAADHAPAAHGDDGHAAPPAEAAHAEPGAEAPKKLDDVASVVAEAQRRLIEQLSRAAEEGLVQFSNPPIDPDAPPADPHAAEHADPQAAEAQDPHAPKDGHDDPMKAMVEAAEGQIEIRSVLERDRPKPAPPPSHCIVDARFVLPVIEAAADPSVAIATRRIALTDALDEVVRPAAADLARVYIALGFGLEARSVMIGVEPPLRAAPLLNDMAYVVDGDDFTADGPLSTQKDCPGLASVWRLSAPGLDAAELPDTVAAAEALAEALAEVAAPLRHRLGAALLTNLLEAGRLEAARRVVSMMDRVPGPDSAERRLAMAKFDIAEGRGARADKALRRLAGGADPTRAEATALLIERMLAQRQPVEKVLIDSAAAAAMAHRGRPLGDRLKAAEIRARGGDRFIPAMDVLETEVERGDIGDQTLRKVAQELYLAASPERDGPVDYAGAAIARIGYIGDGPDSDAAREKTAAHLTGLGLANAALGVVAPGVARSPGSALAAARAHVALGDGEAALELVRGQEGPAAEEIRVAAYTADGRYEDAWQAVAEGPGVDPQTRAAFAWRAGEWRAAAALAPSPARTAFAAWASGASPEAAAELAPSLTPEALAAMGPPPEAEQPSLSGARALIARSRTAESFIEEALRDG